MTRIIKSFVKMNKSIKKEQSDLAGNEVEHAPETVLTEAIEHIRGQDQIDYISKVSPRDLYTRPLMVTLATPNRNPQREKDDQLVVASTTTDHETSTTTMFILNLEVPIPPEIAGQHPSGDVDRWLEKIVPSPDMAATLAQSATYANQVNYDGDYSPLKVDGNSRVFARDFNEGWRELK